MNHSNRRRIRPADVALIILFAGWVPSILMALLSYSILSRALESKVETERRTVVEILANLIGADLARPGSVLTYYANLPQTQRMVLRSYGDPEVQKWLEEIKFSRPNNDGMFLTDREGKLIMSVPLKPENLGKSFSSDLWLKYAGSGAEPYISAVGNRETDGRLCTFMVVPVRAQDGAVIGYFGTNVLVERIGRRLASFNFGEGSAIQILDQDEAPLFGDNFTPNGAQKALDPSLVSILRHNPAGHFRSGKELYSVHPIESTGWTAILEQPLAIAYRPIHDLVGKMAVLSAWLISGTAFAAWLTSRLYRKQIDSDARIARETLFTDTILANIPVGIAFIQPGSGRIIQRNQSWTRMMERFAALPPGSAGRDVRLEDISLGVDLSLGLSDDWREFRAREKKVRTDSGETHFISVEMLRLQDTAARLMGVLMLVTDNTDDVALRQELIAANAAKDQFLALLSHELRNPLSPVITMVAELENRLDGSSEMRTALDVIRRNVELEARLIDDLLDVTRIEHQKLQLNTEAVDAHQIVMRALEISEPDAKSKKLRVELNLKAGHHWVKADPARLQQIFWNLIKNGIKFTQEGTVRIESFNAPGGDLVVQVSDTGIGIEASRIEKIFKPFEQGETSITRQYGGLGLGLAISKAMVEAHGGHISAASPGIDQGSTFTVQIATTVETPKVEPKAEPAPVLRARSRRGQVLLVDDHEDTCAGMKMLLERRGFAATTAHTVKEGIQAAADLKFDIVISDLGLPDGTGFDLMRVLREKDPAVKAIALSGFGMEGDVARSREAGFIEHLIKPVNIENLDALLKRVMG